MYIISKFHDFYDTAMGQGIDKSLVFKREKVESNLNYSTYSKRASDIKPQPIPIEVVSGLMNVPHDMYDRGSTRIIPMILGFCGKFYPFYQFYDYPNKEYIWTVEEFEHQYSKYFPEKIERFYSKPEKNEYYKKIRLYNIKDFYENFDGSKLVNVFTDLNTPIFMIELFKEPKFTNHPSLKEIKFFYVMDAYTAFQEISMYLGGVLGVGQPELVKINDKEMLKKKGFDNMSFKKEKQK